MSSSAPVATPCSTRWPCRILPLCEQRGITLVIGGVMNSGILANPVAGARYDYAEAPPELVERAQGIRSVCERHRVPLRAAAMQFPLAHPQVSSVVAGVRTPAHLDEYRDWMRLPIRMPSGPTCAPTVSSPAGHRCPRSPEANPRRRHCGCRPSRLAGQGPTRVVLE